MNNWLIVRLAIVALSLLDGVVSDHLVQPFEGAPAFLLLIVFGFGVVGMLIVVGIQRINPSSSSIWRYPSWSINPFLLREPLQFFHLGGFFFIALGTGSVLRSLYSEQSLNIALLFLPVLGVGILVGVYTCTLVFHSKMMKVQANEKN